MLRRVAAETMARANASTFRILPEEQDDKEESIKWTVQGNRYEIYYHILTSIEVSEVVTHCVRFKDKLRLAVGTVLHHG